jgi:hypothetical protein
VLYLEGFNAATFRKTLEALDACLERIEDLTPLVAPTPDGRTGP